jgi:S1-C subfamily serine protease
MLHAWEKFGLNSAEAEFRLKYDRRPRKKPPSFARIVKGKIDHIGNIRGASNPLYWSLLKKYAKLDPNFKLKEPPDFIESDIAEIKKAVWVLIDKSNDAQGTAFMLQGVGIVTCDHAIGDEKQMFVFRSPDPLKTEYPVQLVCRDQKLDLAVFQPPLQNVKELKLGDDSVVKQLDPIRLVGFPQHHDGADVSIYEGHLVHWYKFEQLKRFDISPTIIQGNSGGPVLNANNQVVGVAIKGGSGELNAVVPISYIFHIFKAVQST